MAYNTIERYQEAIEIFQDVLKLTPEQSGIWLDLAGAHIAAIRYDEAMDAVLQALKSIQTTKAFGTLWCRPLSSQKL